MESLSDTRIIDLGIRGVQSRIRGARIQTLITHVIGRLFAIGAIAWVLVQLFTLIAFDDPARFPERYFIDSLSFIFVLIELIAIILFTAPLMIFVAFLGNDAAGILLGAKAFLTGDLFGDINPPSGVDSNLLFGTNEPLDMFSSFAYLFSPEILQPLRVINRASIMLFFVVLLIISLIAFLFRADMRSAAAAFVSIQVIVFHGSVQLLFSERFSFTPTKNFGELFSNSVVLIALSSYLFLEIALQISYISQLLNPAQSRQQRVLRALDRLNDFRLGVTKTTLIQTEDSAETEESKEKQATKSIGSTGSSIARKFGVAGMTYFLEKASDSLFSRPGGQRDKLTSRLQRYHDGLVHSDPRVDEKLVGAEVVVKPLMTIVYVLTSVVFRVLIMLAGLYAILNPDILLFVLRYPPPIYNSLEMLQPEGVVLLLIPIVVIILLLTSLIGYIQERFSKRFEEALDPMLLDQEFLEEELPGITTEGELEPITEEDLFYERLEQEFGDDED